MAFVVMFRKCFGYFWATVAVCNIAVCNAYVATMPGKAKAPDSDSMSPDKSPPLCDALFPPWEMVLRELKKLFEYQNFQSQTLSPSSSSTSPSSTTEVTSEVKTEVKKTEATDGKLTIEEAYSYVRSTWLREVYGSLADLSTASSSPTQTSSSNSNSPSDLKSSFSPDMEANTPDSTKSDVPAVSKNSPDNTKSDSESAASKICYGRKIATLLQDALIRAAVDNIAKSQTQRITQLSQLPTLQIGAKMREVLPETFFNSLSMSLLHEDSEMSELTTKILKSQEKTEPVKLLSSPRKRQGNNGKQQEKTMEKSQTIFEKIKDAASDWYHYRSWSTNLQKQARELFFKQAREISTNTNELMTVNEPDSDSRSTVNKLQSLGSWNPKASWPETSPLQSWNPKSYWPETSFFLKKIWSFFVVEQKKPLLFGVGLEHYLNVATIESCLTWLSETVIVNDEDIRTCSAKVLGYGGLSLQNDGALHNDLSSESENHNNDAKTITLSKEDAKTIIFSKQDAKTIISNEIMLEVKTRLTSARRLEVKKVSSRSYKPASEKKREDARAEKEKIQEAMAGARAEKEKIQEDARAEKENMQEALADEERIQKENIQAALIDEERTHEARDERRVRRMEEEASQWEEERRKVDEEWGEVLRARWAHNHPHEPYPEDANSNSNSENSNSNSGNSNSGNSGNSEKDTSENSESSSWKFPVLDALGSLTSVLTTAIWDIAWVFFEVVGYIFNFCVKEFGMQTVVMVSMFGSILFCCCCLLCNSISHLAMVQARATALSVTAASHHSEESTSRHGGGEHHHVGPEHTEAGSMYPEDSRYDNACEESLYVVEGSRSRYDENSRYYGEKSRYYVEDSRTMH